MIRRAPTLIALSDLDVQDVKDHLEKQRAAAMKESDALRQQLLLQQQQSQSQSDRKETSKEERLGLR
ncbi:hypothetical protein SCHPADRAFT_907931 [Schizopora paradoxa]|uniref:Uncharacterized protein n=1 Tax=Schizopora paradoxa TaxID=27342 RepID=A0A0H2RBN1_9AGAM|nr:hypothetical protein SCHPADRAFT_907931 [Schizopora paradoxa]